HANGEEERQPGGELVHIHALGHGRAHVLDAVGDGEGQFLDIGGSGLLHVVAGNGDGVELGHMVRGVADDVGDDAHRGFGRVDIGVSDHELLEDIVLQGARQLVLGHTLYLGGYNIHGHDGQGGAVHGHGYRHLVEGNAVEQNLHVLNGVDGHSRLAHIAFHPRVVGVVTPVGG